MSKLEKYKVRIFRKMRKVHRLNNFHYILNSFDSTDDWNLRLIEKNDKTRAFYSQSTFLIRLIYRLVVDGVYLLLQSGQKVITLVSLIDEYFYYQMFVLKLYKYISDDENKYTQSPLYHHVLIIPL